jgi:hypothetical protein
VLKQREPINGKSVVPVYKNSKSGLSAALTIPIRIAQKYDLYNSDVIFEEMNGGLFIKKGYSPAKTHTTLCLEKRAVAVLLSRHTWHVNMTMVSRNHVT